MRIAVNTISTKKVAGGAYQIAYNFLMETLKHQDEVEWYYITSMDVDEVVGEQFTEMKGKRYFVFPTQPDFRGTYRRVKKELAKWENEYKPDLIYTISSPCYFKFKTTEVMRFANAWVTNTNKYVWKTKTLKERLSVSLHCCYQRRLMKNADYFVTQTETGKRAIAQTTGIDSNRIKVVSNVLPQVFRTSKVERKKDERYINIACVASPFSHKNLGIVPKVLRALKQQYSVTNVRFHLTIPEGHPTILKIMEDSENFGVSNEIINHGRCTQTQLCDIYNRCTICFLPTLLETFSATSLEAMYFGLDIVATDFDFNHEVIENAGLYYSPLDAEDAARKIVEIVQNKQIREGMVEERKKRLTLYGDYSSHFDGILGFLKQVARREI